MIKVSVPNICQPEIKYTLDCLLKEFLGLEYQLLDNSLDKDFHFDLGQNSFCIKNHFFDTDKVNDLYNVSRIPKEVSKGLVRVGDKQYELTSIYGKASSATKSSKYILDADIIGGTFFMLSRWEEHVNLERDDHNRFVAKSSLAYKCGFLDQPIVNEYVELLWKLLKVHGYKGERLKRDFEILPTHDVDIPYLWWSKKETLRYLGGRMYHGKYQEFWNNSKLALQRKDPYDTYDLFMKHADLAGVQSNFFFMTGGNTGYDNRYKIDHPRIKKLVETIIERGHNIGLHPSYNSYNNEKFFKEEKKSLEQISNTPIKIGRQHYLRFQLPDTWRIWEKAGMTWDSTLSFADCSGFRCGVCYPFPVFDFLERRQLKLYERPLIVMEATIISYEKLGLEAARDRILSLRNTVRKYNGMFVFLWHNSSFNTQNYLGYEVLVDTMYHGEKVLN